MNDRFKFRVWDKGNKRYQGTQDWQPYLDTDGDVCFINTDDVRDYPPENYFIIEQCTGIKDRSGKLIYEGDIIRYCVNWRAYCLTYTRVVAWDKNTAGFIMVNGKTQVKPLQKWKFPDPETHIIEIVGNIHEQAEQKE